MAKIRAIIDGKEVVGWYVYACRTNISTEIYWQHELYVPDEIGFTNYIVFNPATTAVATGRKDKHGVEIFGSKGEMQGGDRLKFGTETVEARWSEEYAQWRTYWGESYESVIFPDMLEIIPRQKAVD